MENYSPKPSSKAMTTLSECIAMAADQGYTVEFSVSEDGLCKAGEADCTPPEETHIRNYYRFEGESNPEDMSILYLIETEGGVKGTLTDAYGPYASTRISEFIQQVEDFHKGRDSR